MKNKIILVLGNGFSCGLGFPSMAELWDLCLTICEHNPNTSDRKLLEKTTEQEPLKSHIEQGKNNIEDLLTEWELLIAENFENGAQNNIESGLGYYEAYVRNYACHLWKLCKNSEEEISECSSLLENVMQDYDLRIISLNNDLVIEMALDLLGKEPIYFDPADNKNLILRKIHGSVNWWEDASECVRKGDDERVTVEVIYSEEDKILHWIKDNTWPYPAFARFPVIIPPIRGKERADDQLFAELLRLSKEDAENAVRVVVVGYSFPDADTDVVDLLTELQSANEKTKFHLINSNAAVAEKVNKLLKNFSVHKEKWSPPLIIEIIEGKHDS